MNWRKCPVCHQLLSVDNFETTTNNSGKKYIRAECRPCRRAKARERHRLRKLQGRQPLKKPRSRTYEQHKTMSERVRIYAAQVKRQGRVDFFARPDERKAI